MIDDPIPRTKRRARATAKVSADDARVVDIPPPERLLPRVSQRPPLYRFIYGCMDVLDEVGDAVAHALRLR